MILIVDYVDVFIHQERTKFNCQLELRVQSVGFKAIDLFGRYF